MSMGQLLKTVRDHLRDKLALEKHQCGVQMLGTPPPNADNFYIAIDEESVACASADEHYLTEKYGIVVTILRRAGKYPSDRQGDLLLRETEAQKSLEELERAVIKQIHASWTLVSLYNQELGAPDASLGEIAILPLFYRGRGRTQMYPSPHDQPETLFAWFRRDLRFGGMERKQKLENVG